MPCTKSGILSEILTKARVFVAAFYKKKCSTKSWKCQSWKKKEAKFLLDHAKISGYNTGCAKMEVM